MLKERVSILSLLSIFALFFIAPEINANNSQTQKSTSPEYAAYVQFLNKLNTTTPDTILVAKKELLARFRGKGSEAANDAFKAFSRFYYELIAALNNRFSSEQSFQVLLSKIAEATGLYNNPFPAFDKLDNNAAREIRREHGPFLEELYQYRRGGVNFGQSEGMWYLQEDPDFLADAASITTGNYREYLKFTAEEGKEKLADDGAILISWDELRKKIIRHEKFIKEYPQSPEYEKKIKNSMSWMMDVYLAGIVNSSIVDHGHLLSPEVRKSYEAFLKENISSEYFNAVKDVYAIWTKNNFKTSRELINYLKEKGFGKFTYMLEKGSSNNQTNGLR